MENLARPPLELKAREITTCRSCGGPLVARESRAITFYRLRVDTFIPDAKNLQQRQAMEFHFGSGGGNPHQVAAIADVFSPDVVAQGLRGDDILICLECMVPALGLLERISDRDAADAAAKAQDATRDAARDAARDKRGAQ